MRTLPSLLVLILLAPFSTSAQTAAEVTLSNGTGYNRDMLGADPVVLGSSWEVTLVPQADRGPGKWILLVHSASTLGPAVDLGAIFSLPAAGKSELLIDPGTRLFELGPLDHMGGGTTASHTVQVPVNMSLVGQSWHAQAIVLGDLPASSTTVRTLELTSLTNEPGAVWSEQGFRFAPLAGDSWISSGTLAQTAWYDIFDSMVSIVRLERVDGAIFDALSLDVVGLSGDAPPGFELSWIESDLGDYDSLTQTGTHMLDGEWSGIRHLDIQVWAHYPSDGYLATDSFVVQVPSPMGMGSLDPWFSSAAGGVVGTF